MWANAQRGGRPAEYRWRPLFKAAKFHWRPLLDCRTVTPRPRWGVRWTKPLWSRWGFVFKTVIFNGSAAVLHEMLYYLYFDSWLKCCTISFLMLHNRSLIIHTKIGRDHKTTTSVGCVMIVSTRCRHATDGQKCYGVRALHSCDVLTRTQRSSSASHSLGNVAC